MLGQPACQLERALRLPADAHLQRLQPAQHEPGGVGRGDRARPAAERLDALVARASAQNTSTPASASWWPPRYFVALCKTTSAPCSSGRKSIGVDAVESTSTRRGCARAASMSGNVRKGLDGASSQTRSTPSGGGARLVELDEPDAPALELAEQNAGPVVAPFGEGDRLARRQQPEHAPSSAADAGREEQRMPAVQRAQRRAPPRRRPDGRSASRRTRPPSPSRYGQIVERSSAISRL